MAYIGEGVLSTAHSEWRPVAERSDECDIRVEALNPTHDLEATSLIAGPRLYHQGGRGDDVAGNRDLNPHGAQLIWL